MSFELTIEDCKSKGYEKVKDTKKSVTYLVPKKIGCIGHLIGILTFPLSLIWVLWYINQPDWKEMYFLKSEER